MSRIPKGKVYKGVYLSLDVLQKLHSVREKMVLLGLRSGLSRSVEQSIVLAYEVLFYKKKGD